MHTLRWIVGLFALTLATAASAQSYSEIQLSLCKSEPKPDAAITHCNNVLADKAATSRTKQEAYAYRGHQYGEKGSLKEAFDDFERSLSYGTKYSDVFSLRGFRYSRQNDWPKARADFDKAIQLSPKNTNFLTARAVILNNLRDYKAAIADLDKALRIDSRDAWAYYQRAYAHGESGNLDAAISDLTESIKLDPASVLALNNRGHYYFLKKDLKAAFKDFDEAIRIDDKSYPAWSNRGEIYAEIGEFNRAVSDLDQALKLEPAATFAYQLRCYAKAQLGDLKNAQADCDEALRRFPAEPSVHAYRGFLFAKMGQFDKAIGSYDSALKLDPKQEKAIAWRNDAMRLSGTPVVILSAPAAAAGTAGAPAAPMVVVPVPVPMGKRVALVIGNSAYTAVSKLENPTRDAKAMAESLKRLGFDVGNIQMDLGTDAMRRALREFSDKAADADWALVYYAGHGIEVGGLNYLVPVDARLKSDRDVQFEAIALEQVLASVEPATKLRVVILDACRDNPFVSQMKKSGGTRSIGRGLARVEPEGATLVAFAAKGGQVALDGDGSNSPFVSALLKRIETPGVEINKLFRLVRDDVLNATNKQQEPFTYGSLPSDDFYFKQ